MWTKWYVYVRIEKNGEYVEHDGVLDVEAVNGPIPTARYVADSVEESLFTANPHLRGGRVTGKRARRVG